MQKANSITWAIITEIFCFDQLLVLLHCRASGTPVFQGKVLIMLSVDAERIQASLLRMKSAGRVLYYVFGTIFLLSVAIAIILFGSSVLKAFNPDLAPFSVEPFGIGSIPILITRIIICVSLFYITRLFEDISKGESPFTLVQSRRMAIIGCLLVVGAIAEGFVFSEPPPSLTIPGVVDMRYSTVPNSNQVFFVNGAYVAGAVMCFCLSYAFKYGALLQKLSDDTV